MILTEILKELSIKSETIGQQDFEILGLVGTNKSQAVCTFVDNEKFVEDLSDCVKLVLTTNELKNFFKNKNLCIVEKPRLTFFLIHNYLADHGEYKRPGFKTKIGKNCKISKLADIAENNVTIGDHAVIEEFVSIKENTSIDDNSIIRAGCRIGGEGYEFKGDGNEMFGVKHLGGVQIGKSVEIQYNSCVDKAVFPWDNTIIRDYTKIDNLVHIAHGVKIGQAVLIVANSGIGGRTEIGNESWIGFGATLKNGLVIGNNCRANMGSVVTKDVPDNMHVTGNFAIEHSKFIKNIKKAAI